MYGGRLLLLTVVLWGVGLHIESEAQNVGIGTTNPDNSARLEVADTARGVLFPRMTKSQRNTITTPAEGLLVFVKDDSTFYYNRGTAVSPKWVPIGGKGWKLAGNAGTNDSIHFIGTTDSMDWVIKTDNLERMRVTASGNVGVQHPYPSALLHLQVTDTNRTPFQINQRVLNPGSTDTLDWETATDWDNALRDTHVVHDSDYDHPHDSIVQLGYNYGSKSRLFSYWPLDENSGGTANDVAGSFDASLNGNVTQGVNGVDRTSAYNFDGSNDTYINPGQMGSYGSSMNDGFAMSWWFKSTNGGAIAGNQNSGGYEIHMAGANSYVGWANGKIGIKESDNNVQIYTANTFNDGNWHHAVFVSSNGEVSGFEIYVDGQQQSLQGDVGSNWNDFSDFSNNFLWGAFRNTGGTNAPDYEYAGDLEDIRMYDDSLTAAEIKDIYQAALSGHLFTDWQTFSKSVDINSLQVLNTDVTLNGETLKVVVESDLGGSTEISDTVTLTGGGGPYSVTGLTSDNDKFRLQFLFESSSPWETPQLSGASLAATKQDSLQGDTSFIVKRKTGFVGIGTTQPSERLEVDGNVRADNFLTPSDKRLKKNVQPLHEVLAKLNHIQGVRYQWKDEQLTIKGNNPQQIGLIAQDLQTVYPSLVKRGREGMLSIDYTKLAPVLLEAIKAQQQIIQQQQAMMGKNAAETEQLKEKVRELQQQQRQQQKMLQQLLQKQKEE